MTPFYDLQRLKFNLELTWSIRILFRTAYLKNNSKENQGWRGEKKWMAKISGQKRGPWEPVLSRTSLEWFISTHLLASCKGFWYSLSLPKTKLTCVIRRVFPLATWDCQMRVNTRRICTHLWPSVRSKVWSTHYHGHRKTEKRDFLVFFFFF